MDAAAPLLARGVAIVGLEPSCLLTLRDEYLSMLPAGAAAQLISHSGPQFIMVGASAAISGMMAAAMRFAFQRGGPLGFWRSVDDAAYRVPALPLSGILRDPRVLGFVGVWFVVNLVFGVGSLSVTDANGTGIGGVPGIFKKLAAEGGFLDVNVTIEAIGGESLA